ncbi:MAG: hypothetical protein LBL59_06645 [Xanthomonadaceae bacterium]|jgi:hypothetical protein|nr:hypothetical protein [Xanthomonadaceae bacterium]
MPSLALLHLPHAQLELVQRLATHAQPDLVIRRIDKIGTVEAIPDFPRGLDWMLPETGDTAVYLMAKILEWRCSGA